jgi:hypothetical protein
MNHKLFSHSHTIACQFHPVPFAVAVVVVVVADVVVVVIVAHVCLKH